MKVLIITYYWPPAGGSGVQRWLKFVKYLQDFGIEPIVFTVDNPNYAKEDISLLSEIPKNCIVLKNPIFEPTDLFFWKQKELKKSDVSNSVNNGLMSFIRGNFFIPDPKIFWVHSSVKFLQNYLNNHPIDVIISTGPPHSMHLIAMQLKKKNTLKWIADFRDPWTDLYYNTVLKQLSFAKNKNKKLEKKVLENADCILTVSNSLKKDFDKIAKRVEVITNGFDSEVLQDEHVVLDSKFTISHIGLLPKQSNPVSFFKVIKKLCDANEAFKNDVQMLFVGDISQKVRFEIEKNKLTEIAEFKEYVSHSEAIAYQKKSQVLLLLIPNVKNSAGILTGKLFEYLTAKRPILALGPKNGDLSEILQYTNAGVVIEHEDEERLSTEILRLYQQFKTGNLTVNSKNIKQFHRKKLTEKLSVIIKSMKS
ncbi:MAG: glycosyl transferase family 1 [Flavobacteriaceae bacterium CG_4_10_14_3_um_filter_31_253]|nr:MAG: glycosyl transferase family 1 [Flavobacteriaceae bacterium CG2_30_31_66]PIV96173.1 MAG: glycosyl transferase family 1 [Flavobacteriaceae bacterium CG17_big_fil_post_rev_8_21_14_2_50_31_13]PIX15601.1 MAG: glycosyl transferase family 1 [Flavobacteriaceae bacterium CG_4_8_14_3_um_filter_31_8]PIY14390.1 MAG: glycosyl transferase family 1 [Flavobacteriaceae bacterium CG_4_10_14_3_um_filter_31_253]PIZ10477.1 MAG: glycosyl transferase family 1 [Flavobacteriaceae bacterium CG_4_10_14_0_8_um_fil